MMVSCVGLNNYWDYMLGLIHEVNAHSTVALKVRRCSLPRATREH